MKIKKILLTLAACCIVFPVAAAEDITEFIYGKAMLGDVDGLRSLIEKGYSLDSKNDSGDTAYCLAIYRRNQTAIRTLERAGADIRPRCIKTVPIVTEPMIYSAAHHGNVKQIALWQEYGVPVDIMNRKDGNTALCQAVYEKDCKAIDILLKAGASEYHECMRRVPQKVRNELDCKPMMIDWQRVGLTALGAGLLAGGVAVALSGGGGGSGHPCAINEHWDGEKCTICPSLNCWDGTSCRVAYKGEYIDPLTNRCMDIAPPPYTDGTYTPASFETDEYNRGNFLPGIKASAAYAHGYTGYLISRVKDNNFGALTNGQSSTQGEAKDITKSRVAIGILSTGTEIANTPERDENGAEKKDENGYTLYSRFVNKDLAFENLRVDDDGNVIKNANGQAVGNGTWSGNLARDVSGQLFGYNFDYGYIGHKNDNTGSQAWRLQMQDGVKIKVHLDSSATGSDFQNNSYYSGTIHYFLGEGDSSIVYLALLGGDCTSSSGFCGVAANYSLVDLASCGIDYACFSPPDDVDSYIYDEGYVYNKLNPKPHYFLQGEETRSREQGTSLAGIVAAIRNEGEEGVPTTGNMHGVAYNAQVIPAVADIFRPITSTSVENMITAGSNIILQDISFESENSGLIAKNASGKTMESVYGADGAKAYKKIASSINNVNSKPGIIFVVGTGTKIDSDNKNTVTNGVVSSLGASAYGRDATLSAGVPLTSDGDILKDLFVSVTSVEPNSDATKYGGYTLTRYAQPCGKTASYCLSAPGGNGDSSGNLYSTVSTVVGTGQTNEYNWAENYGTSPAAAVVAGAASVLMSAYPHLSSQEVVKILMQTATPLGACSNKGAISNYDSCTAVAGTSGYSTLYGWGLINLEAATKPVGALWVNNGFSEAINPSIGIYTISSSGLATSSVMSQSLLSVVPSYFTAFDSYNRPFAIDTKALVSSRSVRKEFDDDFKAFMHGRDVMRAEPNDQFTMTYAPRTSYRSSEVKAGLMEVDLDLGKTNLGFYYTEDTLNSRGNYFERSLNNPFVQIQEAYGAEAKYNVTSKFSVGMSYATGKNGFLGDGDKHYKAPENRISFVSTEANYQVAKSVMFKATYGVMKEQDSVLGMVGSGAFKLKGANTSFASAGLEIKPTDKFKLNLAYTYGWTTPEKSDSLMNLSRLTADGFAAVAQYDLGSDNMMGLSVSSPLMVRSGKVSFNLPIGRSATDDTIYRETFTGSMKPTARELDFALFYKDALTEALTIQSELGLRLHPDHDKEARPDYRAMFGLKWNY